MEVANYCSRVTQLDSLILDQEFYTFVKNQAVSILEKLQLTNWVQIYEPEFDFVISTVIWKITVGWQECTIGQRLLGLKYPANSRSHTVFYILSVIAPYLNSRIGSILAKRESPILNIDFQTAKYTKNVNTFWRICLRIIPSKQRLPFPPGDSYQIRELLWHQFSDFLMIVVPFINLHVVKCYWSMIRKYWSPDTAARSMSLSKQHSIVAKCCFCNQDAIIPQFIEKCSFCYYCYKANQLADKDFKSEKCSH